MLKNVKGILFIILAIIILALFIGQYCLLKRAERKNEALAIAMVEKNNRINALGLDVRVYKSADSVNVSRIKILQADKKILTDNLVGQAAKLKLMNIRIKDIEHLSNISTADDYMFFGEMHDTLIMHDTVKVAKYRDKWIDFSMIAHDTTVKVNIKTINNLFIVQHWERYKFLFFRFGHKSHYEDVRCDNPYSDVKMELSIDKK